MAVSRSFAERAVALAAEAARAIGADAGGASLLRLASAAHVELPRAGLVARIERPEAGWAVAAQLFAARFFEERGIRAARLVAAESQPFVLDGGIVTLWRRLRILPDACDAALLGRVARRLHAAGAVPPQAPDLDPFAPIPAWLERAAAAGPVPEIDLLWRRLEQLRASWPEAIAGDPLGTVFVHGDLHADNVLLTPDGPTLVDLEMAGRGPAGWDLVPQLVALRRHGGRESDYRAFCEAYGAYLPDSPAAALLRQVYEFHVVAWALGHRGDSPAMAAEATVRLAGFLHGSDRPWTLI